MITGDLSHHAIQCRIPKWSSCFDWNAKQYAVFRERFLGNFVDTNFLILQIHFPKPTLSFICTFENAFHYKFKIRSDVSLWSYSVY